MPIFLCRLLIISIFGLDVQKSVSDKNKKSCILTNTGRKKLEDALVQEYPEGKYNISEIARNAEIDRNVVGKILNKEGLKPIDCCKPVTFSKLNSLFSSGFNIDLEGDDFREADKKTKLHRPIQPEIPPSSFEISPNQAEEFKVALGKLNYSRQKQLFQSTIIAVKPVGTFLIHGKPDYGQRWLVNQLKYEIPYHSSAWQKSIHIKPHRKDIENIWRNLANELNTSNYPQAIVEELYQHWQKNTVILAIYNVSFLVENSLNIFMEELWQPLVNKINNTTELQRSHRLVLFLIDNKNSKSNLEKSLCLARSLEKNQPHITLVLPELELFSRDVIETWVGVHSQLLSQLWNSPEPIEQVMQNILEGDHNPISVLKDICQCFELDWEQDIAAKLAL
ncbi:MAG: hypothetical protein ACFB02_12320 [Mastigocoleus sp.]